MGIGVSFRGHDGSIRRFDLTGVPKVGDEAAAVLGESSRAVREALSKKLLPDVMVRGNNYIGGVGGGDSNFVKATRDDDNPGPLDEKVSSNGSIEATIGGLRLKGDALAVVADDVVYGKHKGVRGFYKLKDFASTNEDSKRLGLVGVGGRDPCADSAAGESATWQTITRLGIETDEAKRKILYQFERDVKVTSLGFVVEVGSERRSQVGFITDGVTTEMSVYGFIMSSNEESGESSPIMRNMILRFENGLLAGMHFPESSSTSVDVVVDVDYTNPKFTKKKKRISVLAVEPIGDEEGGYSEEGEVVFETTPLTEDET